MACHGPGDMIGPGPSPGAPGTIRSCDTRVSSIQVGLATVVGCRDALPGVLLYAPVRRRDVCRICQPFIRSG